MEGSKFMCPLCVKEFQQIALIAHNPRCYITFCKSLGIVPLCTCPSCEGVRAHPPPIGGVLESPPKKRVLEVNEIEDDEPMSAAVLSPDQKMGKICCLCGVKRSALPVIHVGRYRKFTLCKKEHLTNDGSANELGTLLDKELAYLRHHGDTPTSILADGSGDESKVPSETCTGYKNLDGSKSKCGDKADFLHFEFKNEMKWFCKGSHLVRYMITQCCAHGGASKKKGSKKQRGDDSD